MPDDSASTGSPVSRVYRFALSHAPQFGKYLLSGGSAAFLELGSYKLMLVLNVWYILASGLSGLIGLLSAFLFHKYLVFKKKEKTSQHVMRYAILQTFNFFAQLFLVYVFVEFLGVDPFFAKILGIGATVSWNFFLYKFLVYV